MLLNTLPYSLLCSPPVSFLLIFFFNCKYYLLTAYMEDEDFTSSHNPYSPPSQSGSSLGLLPPSSSQFNCIIFVKFTFNIYYVYKDTVFCSILWLCFLLEYFYLSGSCNCLGFNLFNLLCIFY